MPATKGSRAVEERYAPAAPRHATVISKATAGIIQSTPRVWHICAMAVIKPPRTAAVVRLDPGLAFGTGSHPSTRLALRFLEQHVRGGERVLDYGCGSGVLAIAAAKLGAAQVDAVDVDAEAVQTAAANARTNDVTVRVAAPDALAPALYDLVVSNILAQPLILLAPLLASRTSAGGRIALSGILENQAAEVTDAYAAFFDAPSARIEDGWALIEGMRR